mmetsp:Transcript_8671/g.24817  ORF Transcript_8671/g.24817 Transcript_8671/m.24817 type:complete len:292 (-) Transcript_8671:34-909(-)
MREEIHSHGLLEQEHAESPPVDMQAQQAHAPQRLHDDDKQDEVQLVDAIGEPFVAMVGCSDEGVHRERPMGEAHVSHGVGQPGKVAPERCRLLRLDEHINGVVHLLDIATDVFPDGVFVGGSAALRVDHGSLEAVDEAPGRLLICRKSHKIDLSSDEVGDVVQLVEVGLEQGIGRHARADPMDASAEVRPPHEQGQREENPDSDGQYIALLLRRRSKSGRSADPDAARDQHGGDGGREPAPLLPHRCSDRLTLLLREEGLVDAPQPRVDAAPAVGHDEDLRRAPQRLREGR